MFAHEVIHPRNAARSPAGVFPNSCCSPAPYAETVSIPAERSKNARSMWLVVRLSKSGEPTTAARSAVCILRTPSLRPRRASVPSDSFGSPNTFVSLISEMLSDVKSVWSVIIGRDLYGQPKAVANILNKHVARSPIAKLMAHLEGVKILMRESKTWDEFQRNLIGIIRFTKRSISDLFLSNHLFLPPQRHFGVKAAGRQPRFRQNSRSKNF